MLKESEIHSQAFDSPSLILNDLSLRYAGSELKIESQTTNGPVKHLYIGQYINGKKLFNVSCHVMYGKVYKVFSSFLQDNFTITYVPTTHQLFPAGNIEKGLYVTDANIIVEATRVIELEKETFYANDGKVLATNSFLST